MAVVNRTGAGGAVGYSHVRGQSPDGHALVWNSNSISTAFHAGNMKFDHTAFAGVAAVTSEPVSLAVKADAPWRWPSRTANNAAAGGGMVPLLSLGLPFTPATAVLLSGMLLMNVTPGPFLLRDDPQVFWGVIGSFYVGNVMLLLLNLPLVGLFARVATIPPRWLMPGVLVLCAVAAFADNNNPFDVWVMVGAGLLGWAMRGLGYDPAPLVLGLVLGPLLERSPVQALTIARGDVAGLWSSPPAAVMLAAAVVALLVPTIVGIAVRRHAA